MKLVLIVAGLLAAGVVGGVTADLLGPESSSPFAAPDTDRLEADVSDLKTSVARLTEEVRALRDARLVPNEPAAAGAADPLPPAADTPETAATNQEIEAKVNQLIEERSRLDSEARTQRMNAMWAARDKDRLASMRDELDLTEYQAEELEKILAERRKLMGEMRKKMFEGGRANLSREEIDAMRDKMRKTREESDEKVKNLLSSSQYESYRKMDTGGRGPGGGMGRGGGR
jgi:hypothetical protein